MIVFKSLKQTKRTTTIVFESDLSEMKKKNIAIAMLTGGYNPLRKYSKSGKPVDLERLSLFQKRFNALISEAASEMDVDITLIDSL